MSYWIGHVSEDRKWNSDSEESFTISTDRDACLWPVIAGLGFEGVVAAGVNVMAGFWDFGQRMRTNSAVAPAEVIAALTILASINILPHMQRLQDVKELTKAVLSLYNATVCTVVYCVAAPVPALLAGTAVFSGSFLMACSSQTLNQVIECDYDKLMRRTWNRPIPKGRISKCPANRRTGTALGLGMGATSLVCLSALPPMASAIAVGIWSSYLLVYIPLKRYTRFNTHVGAVIGSLPVYLGWVAATGSVLSPEAGLMFTFMTAWQFPHSYGILWAYKEDFAKAGFAMITNEDTTGQMTVRAVQIALTAQLVSVGGLVLQGTLNPVVALAGLAYAAPASLESLRHFKMFPNSMYGGRLLGASYKVIAAWFYALVGTMGYNWIYNWLSEAFTRGYKN